MLCAVHATGSTVSVLWWLPEPWLRFHACCLQPSHVAGSGWGFIFLFNVVCAILAAGVHVFVCLPPGVYGHADWLQAMTWVRILIVCLRGIFGRVSDYWCGYKLFCYAYYAHSVPHESEFKDSKLGAWHSSFLCFSCG